MFGSDFSRISLRHGPSPAAPPHTLLTRPCKDVHAATRTRDQMCAIGYPHSFAAPFCVPCRADINLHQRTSGKTPARSVLSELAPQRTTLRTRINRSTSVLQCCMRRAYILRNATFRSPTPASESTSVFWCQIHARVRAWILARSI